MTEKDDVRFQFNRQLLKEFEENLANNNLPTIEVYLERCKEPERDQCLEGLLIAELMYLKKRGAIPQIEQYQTRFPAYSQTVFRAFSIVLAIEQTSAAGETRSLVSDSVHSDSISQLNDRYEIQSEIARGGMGVVYRARHRNLNMPVAIKVMLPGESANRFLREAKLLASINCPNVVRVHDFDVLADGQPMICMEWIEGHDIRNKMKTDFGRIEEADAVRWMRHVANGMNDAADLGIIHRDLKPSNILVDSQGNAKVADFGLAKSPSEFTAMSQTGGVMGTPYYMAPEQAEDPRSTNTRSDIYSFGATFYHALTGSVPFEGETPFSVLFKHKTETVTSPQSRNPELSDKVCQILERCLAKSPSDRFQTFAELLEHLRNLSETKFQWDDAHDRSISRFLNRYLDERKDFLSGDFETSIYDFGNDRSLKVISDDISFSIVDAVVSSDDSHLTMGGGVSSSLAENAGSAYKSTARLLAPIRPGRVLVTGAGKLPARFVFHAITIGYDQDGGQLPSRDLIAELIHACFYQADSLNVKSIAFPLLGTGAAGFAKDVCLDTMFRIIARKMLHGVTSVQQVNLVFQDRRKGTSIFRSRLHDHVDKNIEDANTILSKVSSQQMIRTSRPKIGRYSFYDYYKPAPQGGDYFEYMRLGDQKVAIVFGEVSGHSVASSLRIVQLSSAVRFALNKTESTCNAMRSINASLVEWKWECYVTLLLAILDSSSNQLNIVNAGQIQPILRRSCGDVDDSPQTNSNVPIGILDSADYPEFKLDLDVKDSVLLFSTGVVECTNKDGKQYGKERLAILLKESETSDPETITRKIGQDIFHHAEDGGQLDDICIVCLSRLE